MACISGTTNEQQREQLLKQMLLLGEEAGLYKIIKYNTE